MKILITENQLNKIISEESTSIVEPKVLDDKTNTLKKQMKGEKIGQVQKCIGLKDKNGAPLVTNFFGNYTEKLIKSLYSEYNQEIGVTKSLYDKIINNCNKISGKNNTTNSVKSSGTTSGTTKLNPKIYNPSEFNSNAQQIADRLRDYGVPEKSIVAILGNLYVESRFKVNAVGDTRMKGGTSVGIAQWREERKQNLLNYAKKINQDPNQIWVQVDFLMNELKQRFYKPTYDAIMNPSVSISDTAKIFTHNFERPANANYEANKRAQVASQIALAHPDKFDIKQKN